MPALRHAVFRQRLPARVVGEVEAVALQPGADALPADEILAALNGGCVVLLFLLDVLSE